MVEVVMETNGWWNGEEKMVREGSMVRKGE